MIDKRFQGRKKELPLKDEGSNTFLKIMISIAVFLFAVTLAGVLSINSMLSNWNESILGSLTIQIMPLNNIDKKIAKADTMSHAQKTLKLLDTMVEVERATLLEEKQLKKLISPWLGDGVNIANLPLPQLIDVKLKKHAQINFVELSEKLAQTSPLASLDNHKLWLSKLIDFADGLKILAMSVLILVILITSGAIFYSTQTSLGLHRNIIEILHLMGAKDAYIAQQYAFRTAITAFSGGVIGLCFAIPAIFLIGGLASQIQGGIINQARISTLNWIIIISLPIFASLCSTITAYITVKKTLRKMM